MANLIEQLSESQKGYQSHHASALHYHANAMPRSRSRWPLNVFLLLTPVAVSLAWVGVRYYDRERDVWVEENQGKVEIIEVPAVLDMLPYPLFSTLADTQTEVPFIDEPMIDESSFQSTEALSQAGEAAEQDIEEQVVSDDDLLSGLDLSGLSPDIAQRLQVAMDAPEFTNDEPEGTQAQSLVENSSHWFGRLPALNFQTHVYSSNEAKRWVKVNDVEYKQGDHLPDSIELIAIESQACVIEFHGELIRVPALYDWQG